MFENPTNYQESEPFTREEYLEAFVDAYEPRGFCFDPRERPARYLALGERGDGAEFFMELCENERQAARQFGQWLECLVPVRPLFLIDLDSGLSTCEFETLAVARW